MRITPKSTQAEIEAELAQIDDRIAHIQLETISRFFELSFNEAAQLSKAITDLKMRRNYVHHLLES